VICCRVCRRGFVFKQEHDAQPGAASHPTVDVDMAKVPRAGWMLRCPTCGHPSVELTPPHTPIHPTVGISPKGGELIQCVKCETVYSFNDRWTFSEKVAPLPAVRGSKVYLVRANEDEIEAYATLASAQARILELEEEDLDNAGYEQVGTSSDGEKMWRSPSGVIMDQSEAAEEAVYSGGMELPEPEEVIVVD
jgi:hypothetical protein